MQLLAVIVQLLIFQRWALLLGRAKPLDAVSPLCAHVNECNNNLTAIMEQIQSQIKQMHMEAETLFHTYKHQNLKSLDVNSLCNPDSLDLPKFNVTDTSEEEKFVELYKIFQYMKAAIGNIMQHQRTLNPNSKSLQLLNTSKAEITAIISNLSCILCRRYHITEVIVHYGMSFPSTTFQRKTMGCKVLKKYKHFLSQAENITGGWFKTAGNVQDPFTNYR
ncbi:PREDICTED: leukemia inhibitory factor [Nanorana parkeri]|uniref:leukemia inhibitory factor n=1 Tax=Nanorana parkeri TaxID=125878 RepID=UPI0008548FC1|nr:PREDICTED: leukemia inhibitory factor [Nanorana parkeri]